MTDKATEVLISELKAQAKLIVGTRNCRSRELHLEAAAELERLHKWRLLAL